MMIALLAVDSPLAGLYQSLLTLGLASIVILVLLVLKVMKVKSSMAYILTGMVLLVCVLKSGVHVTLTVCHHCAGYSPAELGKFWRGTGQPAD
jgi:Na+/H+ antiporter NhaA